jgi:hypothetical protein
MMPNPKGRAAPQFGSLLPQDLPMQQYEQSMASAAPLQRQVKQTHQLKVMLDFEGQKEMIKDKDMPVKF